MKLEITCIDMTFDLPIHKVTNFFQKANSGGGRVAGPMKTVIIIIIDMSFYKLTTFVKEFFITVICLFHAVLSKVFFSNLFQVEVGMLD